MDTMTGIRNGPRPVVDPHVVPAALFVVALVALGATQSDTFLTTFNISNVLVQVTPLLLVAVGQTFAVAAGGLDLSVGAIVSVVAVVAATLFDPLGAPLAILIALGVGAAIGYLNGIAVASGLEAFLVTLATLSIAQGVALLILPTPGGSVPEWYTTLASYWGPMPIALPLALGVAALATIVLHRHRTGAHILAVGGDRETARVNGVQVRRSLVHAYVLSALCASMAALFLLARIRTGDPTIGTPFTLQSLAAVVLGGTVLGGGRATMLGTVCGALALGLLTNVLNFLGVSSFYQTLVMGTLVITAVLVPNLTSRAVTARRRRASAPHRDATRGPLGQRL